MVIVQETGRVVEHIESWDVEPAAVVKSLLRPSSRAPANSWVEFFKAVDGGDAAGAWSAATPALLKYYALPVVGVSLLTKAATGEGLPVRPAGEAVTRSHSIILHFDVNLWCARPSQGSQIPCELR